MSPPDRDAALRALEEVRNLDANAVSDRIDAEIGDQMLGVLTGLAESVAPTKSRAEHRRIVHAMVLAYLLRGAVDRE